MSVSNPTTDERVLNRACCAALKARYPQAEWAVNPPKPSDTKFSFTGLCRSSDEVYPLARELEKLYANSYAGAHGPNHTRVELYLSPREVETIVQGAKDLQAELVR